MVYIGTILHYDSVLSRTLRNPLWRSARFKALIAWPHNMELWDKWEEILRNNDQDGEALANAFYMLHQLEMEAGAVVSWLARPLLTLMLIRARMATVPLMLNIRMTLSAAKMRHLPAASTSG
ncbi:hypothetical protein M5585_25680 [Serratia ureilytica]